MLLTLAIKDHFVESRTLDVESIFIPEHKEVVIQAHVHSLKVKYARDISMSENRWEIYLTVKSSMNEKVTADS